jgi:hypothetical protein
LNGQLGLDSHAPQICLEVWLVTDKIVLEPVLIVESSQVPFLGHLPVYFVCDTVSTSSNIGILPNIPEEQAFIAIVVQENNSSTSETGLEMTSYPGCAC